MELDLVVLVADADAEWALRTLLEKRQEALGISLSSTRFQVLRHPRRDPGVFREAHEFLRHYSSRARRALVVLDREGSGQEARSAEELEQDLEQRLQRNGWPLEEGNPRAAAIVLDPELEIWVWSRSAHVPEVLGLTQEELQAFLMEHPCAPNGKPEDPKAALHGALRLSGRPQSPDIFRELAERVSLKSDERAFCKLHGVLRAWFPRQSE